MFIGHFGAAFALKRAERRPSLAVLVFAATFVDLLWGIFLLGWERARIEPGHLPTNALVFTSYPYSHSLVAGIGWGLVLAAVYYSWPTRDTSGHRWRAALVVGLAVLSHWFLDLIVHVPDLPLSGDSSLKVGLGLWRNVPASVAAELIVFLAGLLVYFAFPRRGRTGPTWRILAYAGLLLAIYVTSLLGGAPPSIRAVAWVDIAGTLIFVALAAWAEPAKRRKG
jgi:hypothetical protein